jgi:hypothetical protein
MKNPIKISTATLAMIILFLNACKHKADEPPACVAGSGGGVMFVVYAFHNNISIPNYYTHPDTAFVKFGTTSSPGPDPLNYNTYFVSEAGEDHIHCTGLKCGDYFIYRTAWDSVAGVSRYGGYGISFSDTSGIKSVNVVVN